MKHAFWIQLFLFLWLSLPFASAAQNEFQIPEKVNRIVFLGNSITYAGTYINYIETWLTLNYSEKHYEIINVGLPSETVSGLSEPNHANGAFPRPDLKNRLSRVLKNLKPDLIFACYGMNDGIYMPFDDSRFEKYKKGINFLHDEVRKAGAGIVLITPPVYDEQKGPAYSNVLDIYSSWLLSKRFTNGWNVIDIHWPMKKYLENKRTENPLFALAKDGIHPHKEGHWIMAKHILLGLGYSDAAYVDDPKKYFSQHDNGEKIFKLISTRQAILKDAWLNSIGHKRPNMKTGIPLEEAINKTRLLTLEILDLVHQE